MAKVTEKEKQEAIAKCLKLLGRAKKELDKAYDYHLINNTEAANDMSKTMARYILKQQLETLKEQGLTGVSFYPVKVHDATVDDYCAELSRLLETIEHNEGTPLQFNDSQEYADCVAKQIYSIVDGNKNEKN